MRQFPLHTGLTIALVAVLLAAVRLVAPAIQGPRPAQLAAMVDFEPEHVPLSPLSRHEEPMPAPPPTPVGIRIPAARVLFDDAGGVLDPFYKALWAAEKHEAGAVVRIVHYGDSPTTADLITGDIRALLQQRFGDAGHGFVLVAKPWAWYQHDGVGLSGSGCKILPASHYEAHDGMFGLGGVSFTGGSSARSRITFRAPGQSRFEVWFLNQPGGGALSVKADGRTLGRINTSGASKTPGFVTFEVETPARELELEVEQGTVRVFGIAAGKPGPGVVYDSLGLNGASITVLSRMFDQTHWGAQLAHRAPHLVTVNYGTNEADFAAFVERQYEKELREAIRRIRAALPDAAILIMSPMDRGRRNRAGEIETMATIPQIVDIQRRVARETGCGFFDTFDAMGGSGTMARWYAAQPRLVSADFIHPYPAGGRMIAVTFTREIGRGLNRYKLRQVVQEPSAPATR